ncbi:MAG: fibro-slime domain-containing protein, partial [Chitinivibrionales bacterium]|nr:fibro-slime domain-containing protein [Chitinivibrionales bacterium]
INSRYNDRLNEWFRPGAETNTTSQFRYNYDLQRWEWTNLTNYSGRPNEWVLSGFDPNYDMATIVMYDSLPFTLVDATTGTYEFDSDAFFPIDGRGWGAQPASYVDYNWTNTEGNNFSFAMELHVQFTYGPGLSFNFSGDDDVWAFIDGSLEMNLGGIHGELTGAIDLDTLNLVNGETYTLHFFYCERHVTGSHIQITTNLVAPLKIDSLRIAAVPNYDQIPVDSTITYTAQVWVDTTVTDPVTGISRDSSYECPECLSSVRWSLDGDPNNPPLTNDNGGMTQFVAQRAHVTYVITASIFDPTTRTMLTASDTVTVLPGPAHRVYIEKDDTPDNWVPDTVDVLTLQVGQNADTVYAVVRDKYDNLIGLGQAVSWGSNDNGVAQIRGTTGKSYEGVITRSPLLLNPVDSSVVTVSQGGVPNGDDALVIVSDVLKVATPMATPGSMTFTGQVEVTLSTATEGATIYYCTACTGDPVPNAPNVHQYTGPIVVSAADTTTIRAIAVKDQWENSDVGVYTYVNDRDTRGPQVVSAELYLGNPPGHTGPAQPDTLIIIFDEPVRTSDLQSPADVFLYTDNGAAGQQSSIFAGAELVPPGDTLADHIVIVFPEGAPEVTPEIDLLRFAPGAVHDRWGNASEQVPETVVQWGRVYDIVIAISSNPFYPGRQAVDIGTLNLSAEAVAEHGPPPAASTAIRVTSVRDMDHRSSTATVYDALGNVVQERLPLYPTETDDHEHTAYFFWNARNRSSRLVGSGTYLAVLNVSESETGRTKATSQKIGVMR